MAQVMLNGSIIPSYSEDATTKLYQEYERQLQHLAREIVEVILTCDEYHPWVLRHIAVNFRGTHDLAPGSLSMVDYMGYIRYLKALHPGARVLVSEDFTIDFDESQGDTCAVVWQFARVRLESEGIVRGRLGMSNWRLLGGTWVCYRYGVWRCDSLALGRIAPRFEAEGVEGDEVSAAEA